jgi:hypothetical protein
MAWQITRDKFLSKEERDCCDHPAGPCPGQPDSLFCLAKWRTRQLDWLDIQEPVAGDYPGYRALHFLFLCCRIVRKRLAGGRAIRAVDSLAIIYGRKGFGRIFAGRHPGCGCRPGRRNNLPWLSYTAPEGHHCKSSYCCATVGGNLFSRTRLRGIVAGVVTVGAMGLVFALVYMWRKSLVAPIVMHFLQDFIGIVLLPLFGRG